MKIAFALVVASFAALLSTTYEDPVGPEWIADLESGFALAAETDRPLLIVFR